MNVTSEVIVVEMVKNWLEADSKNRTEHLETLLRAVRLDQLHLSELLELENTPPFNNSIGAIKMISETKNFHLASGNNSISLPISRGPRNSYAGVLICVGGRGNEGDPYKSVEYLEAHKTQKMEWKSLPDMRNARRHVGAIALGKCLYAVGGHSGKDHLSRIGFLDLNLVDTDSLSRQLVYKKQAEGQAFLSEL